MIFNENKKINHDFKQNLGNINLPRVEHHKKYIKPVAIRILPKYNKSIINRGGSDLNKNIYSFEKKENRNNKENQIINYLESENKIVKENKNNNFLPKFNNLIDYLILNQTFFSLYLKQKSIGGLSKPIFMYYYDWNIKNLPENCRNGYFLMSEVDYIKQFLCSYYRVLYFKIINYSPIKLDSLDELLKEKILILTRFNQQEKNLIKEKIFGFVGMNRIDYSFQNNSILNLNDLKKSKLYLANTNFIKINPFVKKGKYINKYYSGLKYYRELNYPSGIIMFIPFNKPYLRRMGKSEWPGSTKYLFDISPKGSWIGKVLFSKRRNDLTSYRIYGKGSRSYSFLSLKKWRNRLNWYKQIKFFDPIPFNKKNFEKNKKLRRGHKRIIFRYNIKKMILIYNKYTARKRTKMSNLHRIINPFTYPGIYFFSQPKQLAIFRRSDIDYYRFLYRNNSLVSNSKIKRTKKLIKWYIGKCIKIDIEEKKGKTFFSRLKYKIKSFCGIIWRVIKKFFTKYLPKLRRIIVEMQMGSSIFTDFIYKDIKWPQLNVYGTFENIDRIKFGMTSNSSPIAIDINKIIESRKYISYLGDKNFSLAFSVSNKNGIRSNFYKTHENIQKYYVFPNYTNTQKKQYFNIPTKKTFFNFNEKLINIVITENLFLKIFINQFIIFLKNKFYINSIQLIKTKIFTNSKILNIIYYKVYINLILQKNWFISINKNNYNFNFFRPIYNYYTLYFFENSFYKWNKKELQIDFSNIEKFRKYENYFFTSDDFIENNFLTDKVFKEKNIRYFNRRYISLKFDPENNPLFGLHRNYIKRDKQKSFIFDYYKEGKKELPVYSYDFKGNFFYKQIKKNSLIKKRELKSIQDLIEEKKKNKQFNLFTLLKKVKFIKRKEIKKKLTSYEKFQRKIQAYQKIKKIRLYIQLKKRIKKNKNRRKINFSYSYKTISKRNLIFFTKKRIYLKKKLPVFYNSNFVRGRGSKNFNITRLKSNCKYPQINQYGNIIHIYPYPSTNSNRTLSFPCPYLDKNNNVIRERKFYNWILFYPYYYPKAENSNFITPQQYWIKQNNWIKKYLIEKTKSSNFLKIYYNWRYLPIKCINKKINLNNWDFENYIQNNLFLNKFIENYYVNKSLSNKIIDKFAELNKKDIIKTINESYDFINDKFLENYKTNYYQKNLIRLPRVILSDKKKKKYVFTWKELWKYVKGLRTLIRDLIKLLKMIIYCYLIDLKVAIIIKLDEIKKKIKSKIENQIKKLKKK
jgi:hypothetical protein